MSLLRLHTTQSGSPMTQFTTRLTWECLLQGTRTTREPWYYIKPLLCNNIRRCFSIVFLFNFLQNINFYYTPYSINGDRLQVDLRITASNNFSAFSMCLRIEFPGELSVHDLTCYTILYVIHLYTLDVSHLL